MSQRAIDLQGAIERQVGANETSAREADDYVELHIAAVERLEADLRSRHALLPGKGASIAILDQAMPSPTQRQSVTDASYEVCLYFLEHSEPYHADKGLGFSSE